MIHHTNVTDWVNNEVAEMIIAGRIVPPFVVADNTEALLSKFKNVIYTLKTKNHSVKASCFTQILEKLYSAAESQLEDAPDEVVEELVIAAALITRTIQQIKNQGA